MEVDIVARVRVQVGRELLGARPDGTGGLLEDALAFTVADDVVCLSSEGLR